MLKQADDLVSKNGHKKAAWLCKCQCGTIKRVDQHNLKSGGSKSCGCYVSDSVRERCKKYNTYDISGEYGIGYTYKNEQFFFDLEDYDKIKDYYWTIHNGYVQARTSDGHWISMHRYIMGVTRRQDEIDHIHHKKYDNRKSELRIVTSSQNNMNKRLQSNNTSGCAGVSYHIRDKKWKATIKLNGKTTTLGWFKNKEDAIAARRKAENEIFKEYSYLNSQKIS